MRNRCKAIAVAVGAATLMAGCDPGAAAEPPAIPTDTAPAVRVAANQAPAEAGDAATSNDPNSAVSSGCPVTAELLLTALRSDPDDIDRRAGRPDELVEVFCYQGFAVARTPAGGIRDRVGILFRFDSAPAAGVR